MNSKIFIKHYGKCFFHAFNVKFDDFKLKLLVKYDTIYSKWKTVNEIDHILIEKNHERFKKP